MSSWNFVYTEQTELALRDILEYVAFPLLEAETARKQARLVLDTVEKLSAIPNRHPRYQNEPWNSKGLRVVPVDNFLAFYFPAESQKRFRSFDFSESSTRPLASAELEMLYAAAEK